MKSARRCNATVILDHNVNSSGEKSWTFLLLDGPSLLNGADSRIRKSSWKLRLDSKTHQTRF